MGKMIIETCVPHYFLIVSGDLKSYANHLCNDVGKSNNDEWHALYHFETVKIASDLCLDYGIASRRGSELFHLDFKQILRLLGIARYGQAGLGASARQKER